MMTATEAAEKRREVNKARKALRDCQQDRDRFMSRYPDHKEAARMYKNRIEQLNAVLDKLIRGQ